ncbi:MAG: antibiotic biosynthesis monooxygenase [Actinobacteria bacterium]|jgi:heme-degrading monooxygenase HmoA|nr:antibiotic biosynthesis monooxygenase [Actinomycetota bacterium]PLS83878.1 MAG: antibiotic biosynthesis monooxygenase [Actinomycetota bacterium]
MVREIAVFEVQEGQGENFVEAYNGVAHVLNGAKGSHGATLHRGIENPSLFTLIVEWDSVDAHTALTKEPEFKEFGDAVGPFLAGRPEVGHVEAVG